MTDKTLDVCQCHEKHAPTYWKGVAREYKDALEKAESRPLTPDAITDEMVERGRSAYWGPTYGGSVVGREGAGLCISQRLVPLPHGLLERGLVLADDALPVRGGVLLVALARA